jgi:hypothetical protein
MTRSCDISHWTDRKIRFLKDNVDFMTITKMAEILNFSRRSVAQKMRKLKILKDSFDGGFWTESELEILKNNYQSKDYEKLQKLLNRGRYEIIGKLRELGLLKVHRTRPWNCSEDNFLKEHYYNMSMETLCKQLNRGSGEINRRLDILNLKRNIRSEESMKKFYETIHKRNEELESFIKENYSFMETELIAKKFNKTKGSIEHIASRLGVKKLPKKSLYSKQDDEIIRKYYGKVSPEELCKMLPGKNYVSIQNHVKTLSLPKKTSLIEIHMQFLLKINNIPYIYQFKVPDTNYTVDFLIDMQQINGNKEKLIIETYGDYWHGNLTYRNKLNKIQKRQMKADIKGNEIIGKKRYKLFIIWEYDIMHRPHFVNEYLKALIKRFS